MLTTRVSEYSHYMKIQHCAPSILEAREEEVTIISWKDSVGGMGRVWQNWVQTQSALGQIS